RRDRVMWNDAGEEHAGRFARLCIAHGVAPLVEQRLRLAGTLEAWPQAIVAALRAAVAEQTLVSPVREQCLCAVLDGLAASSVSAFLIKGAAVARTHYENPALRPSGDADLLIRLSELHACRSSLETLGYAQLNETVGRLVTYQQHFVRRHAAAIDLVI